jgi:MOSC domain-containing protein YiiM
MLRRHNLDGDGQADLLNHGGEYKAVYAYPVEHYAFWKATLARDDFAYGQFGENFTVEGVLEEQAHIGDIFRIGGAMVQVTQPRVPCFKSAIKMGMATFPKLFLESERSGFYLRVVQEGEVKAGDSIELVEAEPLAVSIREIHHLHFFDRHNAAGLRRALSVGALAPAWREDLESLLAEAQ